MRPNIAYDPRTRYLVRAVVVLGCLIAALGNTDMLANTSAATSVTFTPAADAYVDSSNPTTNYGTSTQIRVDGSPTVRSYLRFSVSGLTAPVASAILRIYANSSQSTGYTAYRVSDNTWGETTINYGNAPALGTSIGSSGAVSSGTWTSVNVTTYITGNGTWSLALATTNSTALSLASRESGANAPQLVITLASATPTNTATATSTSAPTKTFTPTNTPVPPTATNTALPPTATNTPANTPTNTLAPATNTPTSTATQTAASTSTNTPTNTATATQAPAATNTPTDTPTNTAVPAATNTPTDTPTNTATATNTVAATVTDTPTNTPTQTAAIATATSTATIAATNTPVTPVASSTTFVPAADSYVDSSNPSANFGTSTQIRIDGSPIVNSYLRFSVSGLAGTVTKATLRIYANSSLSAGYEVHAVADNTWGETTINYSNAPAFGNTINTSGAVTSGSWNSIDVTSYVTGNGTFSFGLRTTSSTALSMASRESGANAPQLIIQQSVSAPTNTATATATSTATSAPTATPTGGSVTPGSLCVLVYNDLNGSGTFDQGEPLLTGAGIAVKNSSNAVVGTYNTNGTEPFCFTNLAPDTFTVTETNPAGYASTTPDIVIALVQSGLQTSVNFGDQAFTPTPTATVTNTPTNTPIATPTMTPTNTPTLTATPTPLPTTSGDPVIVTAGDIACDPANSNFSGSSSGSCQMAATANLIAGIHPSGVLNLGDNQYYCGSLTAYQESYQLSWGAFKSITHPSVGNHEYLTSGGTGCDSTNANAAGYFAYFGSSAGTQGQGYYSYDVGTWHLIALNSNCSNAGGCSASSPQGQWLTADLASHSNMCTLAYWHIPVWSSGGRASSNMLALTTILYNYNADLILDAHDHLYERFAPQDPSSNLDLVRGIRSFVVGTGGANHTSFSSTIMPNSEVRNDKTFGVLKLTLHPSSFDWNFVPVPGQTFTDSGTQNCH